MTTKASDIPEAPMEETENVDTSLEDISLQNSTDLQAQLRQEAYQWPRLIFRPLKKSGHIILDSCTVEGLCILNHFARGLSDLLTQEKSCD